MYLKKVSDHFIYVDMYVDDMLLVNNIMDMIDPRGSKNAKILKSSNLSKTKTRSKGSSRQFQWRSFHLKRTPYEKVIAFYSMRSTGEIC